MQTIKKSAYRQRVYQLEDGSIQLVFGDQDALFPVGSNPKLLADHDIVDTAIITDHLDG